MREAWYYNELNDEEYKICSKWGEDDNCSLSQLPIGVSVHTLFFGEYTGCDLELMEHVGDPKYEEIFKAIVKKM